MTLSRMTLQNHTQHNDTHQNQNVIRILYASECYEAEWPLRQMTFYLYNTYQNDAQYNDTHQNDRRTHTRMMRSIMTTTRMKISRMTHKNRLYDDTYLNG